jgi:hypothetical protein
MYAAGETAARVFERTNLSEKNVRRLVKRCTAVCADGAIAGFYALLSSFRLQSYTRSKAVHHVIGGGSGGCSGALQQLFNRFPEVEAWVESLVCKDGKPGFAVHEARIPYGELHTEFLRKLGELGLTRDDWPFNTENLGYKSLCIYCGRLINEDSYGGKKARFGPDAARRSTVGNGFRSLLPPLRPFGAAQLDFTRVDAASIISIENPYGVCIDVPLPRWHFGLIVEERFGLAIGVCIALELNPSSDSVLELIETAIRPIEAKEGDPKLAFVVDGKILPNQLFPELAYQGFNILKMDNAKSNAAAEVVANIIDTVGCAVNFGPIKAWWRRGLVERIFGALTRKGLQRLPSTYGSGPSDTRRSDSPNYEAVKFKIKLSELVAVIYGCIREYNEARGDTLMKASPIAALQASMHHPASGFMFLPLPRESQQDLRLMSHIEHVTIRGNIKKNIRPYVSIGRWRYTSTTLARLYSLIGEKAIAYCDRRQSDRVRLTVISTGEDLGWVYPPRRWADVAISFRDRALINSKGYAAQLSEKPLSPVRQWVNLKAEELSKKTPNKSKRPTSSKDALALAKIAPKIEEFERQKTHSDPIESADKLELNLENARVSAKDNFATNLGCDGQEVNAGVTRHDPFGLFTLPEFLPIPKGE